MMNLLGQNLNSKNGAILDLYVINEENKLVLGNFDNEFGSSYYDYPLTTVCNVNCIVDVSHLDNFYWRMD